MGSIVFVHGIGVRESAEGGEHPFEATCRVIRFELALNQIGLPLVPCGWGDDLGARLRSNGQCFPKKLGTLGVPLIRDDPAGLWQTLLEDPTFELRALSAIGGVPGLAAPGQKPAWVQLQVRLATLVPDEALRQMLSGLQLEEPFKEATDRIRSSKPAADAIYHPQCARALARAITALTVRIGESCGIPPPPLPELEQLAAETERVLQVGQLGGVGDWAKTVILGWATTWAERQRTTLAGTATPIAGDVIYYQAQGSEIRARINEVVGKAPEPVAMLAHSLGGIAGVEALCETPELRKRVRKLITVGSQSGFFYEINALRTLPFGAHLPPDFPDWLNLWDNRDLLSFLVEPVFSGGRTRRDLEVQSGLPFPSSHSGYWRQRAVWEAIKTFLAD
jgi:hypothetical protein